MERCFYFSYLRLLSPHSSPRLLLRFRCCPVRIHVGMRVETLPWTLAWHWFNINNSLMLRDVAAVFSSHSPLGTQRLKVGILAFLPSYNLTILQTISSFPSVLTLKNVWTFHVLYISYLVIWASDTVNTKAASKPDSKRGRHRDISESSLKDKNRGLREPLKFLLIYPIVCGPWTKERVLKLGRANRGNLTFLFLKAEMEHWYSWLRSLMIEQPGLDVGGRQGRWHGGGNELRKTHGLPKRKWSYETRWKNQFFQDNAFCIPPLPMGSSAGDVRKLKEYQGSPGYLTGGKSPGEGRQQGTGSRFSWHWDIFKWVIFQQFPRRILYQFPASIWDLKPTGSKDPSHDLFSSFLN